MVILSDNGISRVWFEDGKAYKMQPKTMMDNAMWAYGLLMPTGIVPVVNRLEDEVMEMQFITQTLVEDRDLFIAKCRYILYELKDKGIRHGDLTPPHIIPHNRNVYVIDFGESRPFCDPRPDKRREGDTHWMIKSCNHHLVEAGFSGVDEL